jgi:type IV pilus assembly protein PilX
MTYKYPGPVRMPARRSTQRGVVLIIALIVLVAMTLAGVGMMRSVDTNSLIAGNLAFKNAATGAGDAALESARSWLQTQTAGTLEENNAALGYFANWQPTFAPGLFDWNGSSKLVGTDPSGNTLSYVVHRMCNESGKSINATDCAKVAKSQVGVSKGTPAYGLKTPKATALVFYRITARITGPKYTVSYVQAFVY